MWWWRRIQLSLCELFPCPATGCSLILFPLPLFMTEWMCKYTPIWISRGGSLHKAFFGGMGKVDVGEVRAVTNRFHLLLPQRMKWLPKTFNTPPRARHTVMCVTRSKTSGEGTIDAPLWKYQTLLSPGSRIFVAYPGELDRFFEKMSDGLIGGEMLGGHLWWCKVDSSRIGQSGWLVLSHGTVWLSAKSRHIGTDRGCPE